MKAMQIEDGYFLETSTGDRLCAMIQCVLCSPVRGDLVRLVNFIILISANQGL